MTANHLATRVQRKSIFQEGLGRTYTSPTSFLLAPPPKKKIPTSTN